MLLETCLRIHENYSFKCDWDILIDTAWTVKVGHNLKAVWAEFSIFSKAVLLNY
jgi:hypothetical protein